MSSFSKAMRQIMVEKGMRQVDVVNASGESKSYVHNVLTGYIKSVPFNRACNLIDALGVTLEEFRAIELTFEESEDA